MAANTSPIYTLTPNIGKANIPTAAANVKNNGVGTLATDIFKAFTAGSFGSYVDKVIFNSVSSAAATTGVATVLRVFLSTISSGATSATDTFLLGEISVPAVLSDNTTVATNNYEVPIGLPIPTGYYIHVSQHVAQTANQNWNAIVCGGDY